MRQKCSVCGRISVTAGKFIPCAECIGKNNYGYVQLLPHDFKLTVNSHGKIKWRKK